MDKVRHLNNALQGRYRIEREMGSGGMATVYTARDLKHDRQVAVKVFRSQAASSIGHVRFLREIQIAARLNHPHILTLIDSGHVGDVLYYVMPQVDGESLRSLLDREGPRTFAETARLIGQIASALDYAHEQGIIHRDIKPENILIHRGEAMVSDFGIAVGFAAARAERLTATGAWMGTPSYMSPEQVGGGDQIDARSDVYSLGCLTYEMLTGRVPFSAATTAALIAKILTEDPPWAVEFQSDLPPAASKAIAKALARSVDQRPATAGALARALTEAVNADALERKARRRIWPAVVGTVAVAGVITATLLLPRSSPASVANTLSDIDNAVLNRDWITAYGLVRGLEGKLEDSTFANLTGIVYGEGTLITDPPGAHVSWRPYDQHEAPWESLGTTPLEAALPRSLIAVKLDLDGYESRVIGSDGPLRNITWKLRPIGDQLSDVVHIPGRNVNIGAFSPPFWLSDTRPVSDFLIDVYEVKNRQYQAFVDDRGYDRPELWEREFRMDGRVISWVGLPVVEVDLECATNPGVHAGEG